MRVPFVPQRPELVAYATAAALALALAACGDPVGPREPQSHGVKGDSVTVLQRVHQLDDVTPGDTAARMTPTLPWY
jgi:hypothetical protein